MKLNKLLDGKINVILFPIHFHFAAFISLQSFYLFHPPKRSYFLKAFVGGTFKVAGNRGNATQRYFREKAPMTKYEIMI